ncbi:MAG: response regulator [bacterium]|nr:response regulator [bacterium]MCZ6700467.1 response regulator [bacterium]MDV2480293.1 response regulator [bacterium]
MKTILLIEDVEDNRDLVVQILESEYTVVEARDGQEGLEKARATQPHLILLDLALPKMDGWEAARRLKADPALKAIPIIALTAFAMEGDEARALEAGCNAYVAKPILPKDLRAHVRRVLEEFEAQGA